MAGHSKWSNIKRHKAVVDAKRGKIWTKVSKEITVATRLGGKDVGSNPRLRDAIVAGKAANMPKDTIARAIARGAGEIEGAVYEEIVYEGYGPGGAAIIVESMTDNRNRTVSELRHMFSKNGGNLGESGCVAWIFTKKGFIEVEKGNTTEDELMEFVLEVGADDLAEAEAAFEVSCDKNDLGSVREAIAEKFKVISFEVVAEPANTVELAGDNSEKMIKLLELLDDHDDVQNVHTNAEFSE